MSKKSRSRSVELTQNDGQLPQDPQQPRKVSTVPPKAVNLSEDSWMDHVLPILLGMLCAYLPFKVEPHIRDLFQLPKQLILAEAAAWFIVIAGALTLAGRLLKLPRSPMIWPSLVLALAIAGGVWIAPSQTGGVLSIFAKVDAHRWAAAGVIFLVAMVSLNRPQRLWYVIAGNLLGGLIVSMIGIQEQSNFDHGLNPEPMWNLITIPGSTFGNRNMAAQQIAAVIPATYALIALSLRWWLTKRTTLALGVGLPSVGILLTLLYYLILTVTRSAWLGAFLGILVAGLCWALGLLMARRKHQDSLETAQEIAESGLLGSSWRKALVPVAAVLVAVMVIAGIFDASKRSTHGATEENQAAAQQKEGQTVVELLKSFTNFKENHYRWRFGMAESTIEAIKDKPLGGGAGNWRVIYPQYVTQREKNEMFNIAKQPIRAHNDFLQFGSEFGVHGLLALLTLLAMAAWLSIRSVKKAASPLAELPSGISREDAAWAAFCALSSLAAIIAICGDAMASFPLQLPGPTFLFALHLAIIGSVEAMLYQRGFFGDKQLAEVPVAQRKSPPWLGYSLLGAGLLAIWFLAPLYLTPSSLNLDTYRTMPIEQVQHKGLHERWIAAELGFTDGRALQKYGNAQAGLLAIQRAIAINPDDFQNHFIEGLNLNSLNKTADAIHSIENSLRLYPNLLNAWVNLAMFNRRLGDDKKMNHAIDTALKLKPDELIALNVRAQWMEEKGDFAGIIKILKPQVKGYAEYRKSPNWPHDDQGQLWNSWKTSLTHLKNAAKKTEDWADLADWLPLLDVELDEVVHKPRESEVEYAARMIKEEPIHRKERMDREAELADVLGPKLGRWQDALPHFKLAAELARNEHPVQKRNYALAALHLGDLATAEHELGVAVQLKDDRAEIGKALDAVKASMPEKAAEIAKLRARFGDGPAPAAPAEAATPE